MAVETTQTATATQQPISNGGIITPEAWASFTPEQRATYPKEVQDLFNQQLAMLNGGIPAGTIPIMPTMTPLTPNQDKVVVPNMGQQPQAAPQPAKMTLSEQKALVKDAVEGTGCARDWYEVYKVSFTSSHDISAMIAGALIAGFCIAIVYGVVCLIRRA